MIASVLDNYRTIYEKAKTAAKQNADGSVAESEMVLRLMDLINIDVASEKERKAKQIIDALCKSKSDHAEGQLCFPGFGSWDWEPLRLVRSEHGNLIENAKATLPFKIADTQRSERHAADAQASSRRKRHEVDVFTAWTVQQMQEGVPSAELTWGRCIEELGVHDPLAPPSTDEPSGQES